MSSGRAPWRRKAVAVALALVMSACSGGGGGDADSGDPLDEETAAAGPGERAVQVVSSDRTRLFGTLSVPPSAATGGVLVVPATTPGDRNGVIGPTGEHDGLGQELAEKLTGAGLVTYRYDRRGTGESKLEPGVRLGFDALVEDARAALSLLAQRKETAGRDLTVVGYGTGGLVALRLAATDERVKRLVLVSTPGRSLVDVQAAELRAAYGPESAEALQATVAGLLANRSLPALDALRAELRPLLPPEEASFLAELYSLDPAAEAARVRAEALVVVPRDAGPYDAPRLSGALRGAPVVISVGGPTLSIIGPGPTDDPSDPASASHDHGSPTPVAKSERDPASLAALVSFAAGGVARP